MVGPEWSKRASCNGVEPELFFPDEREVSKIQEAKAVCRNCPARLECLLYAIEVDAEEGIFGGSTYPERVRMKALLPLISKQVSLAGALHTV